MALHALLAKAGATVATGFVGAVAYDAVRTVARRAPLREGAVVATTWGIRGTRKAEESTPPGTAVAHDHDHDH